MKLIFKLIFCLCACLPLSAQMTAVTAAVLDPHGIPYAGGTVLPQLITPGGPSPTLNGNFYVPPTSPTALDGSGKFSLNVADNSVLLPAGTQWKFTVCSGSGSISPASGKGSVCFNVTLAISGTTQDISTQLQSAALALNSGTPGILINTQGSAGAITGTGAAVTVYTFTLPANTVVQGNGLRITAGMNHTGAAAVTFLLSINGVTIFSIATADGAPVATETMIVTGSTAAAGAGWLTKVLSGTLTGGTVNTITGLNFAAAQTVTLTFNVAATDTVTPIFWMVEKL